jgi:serine protease AprX
MTPPRHRLLALTSAAVLSLSVLGPTGAAAGGSTSTTAYAAAADRALERLVATRPGLARLTSAGPSASGPERAIVTFDAVPTSGQVAALRALGLVVQPMEALPLALVAGPRSALLAAVVDGIGLDVYPDEQLSYHDTASSDVTSSSPKAAAALRRQGLTGKGVTVGIVDSGCDGTHPDLAQRMAYNTILVSPEYVNAGTDPMLVVPTTGSPYDNTDLGSGHGTHVAGIVAADGTSGPEHIGVAPDAELACFAIGAVITTTAVVTAYDHMLADDDMFDIDVINNSWGNSFRQYDPADPVNVATKAVTERGAVVVFSAGNSGSDDAEASVSPFNQAPWVISVAASDLDRKRGGFSSNGLEHDNLRAVPIGEDGHTVVRGDRFGSTSPDMTAPGVQISSSCDSTGSVIGPCPQGGNASASGTSMSSPHIAGVAAVLVQANPRLSPRQVQDALKATATRVSGDDGTVLSYQVGYGHVNLDKAVRLVKGKKGKRLSRAISKRLRAADRRLAREDAWTVRRSDVWQDDAPVVALGGSYSATREVRVGRRTDALKVALVYPTPGTAANLALYTATVRDTDGGQVAQTTTEIGYSTGSASALVEGLAPGRYTVEVTGDYSVSDPDTIDSDSLNGRVVFLQVAQLRARR